MKIFIQTISIRTKLTFAILLSCTLLLVVVGGSFLVVELYSSRAALVQEVTTLASSLATNSSRALVLGKYSEIEEILSSLTQQKNIHAAYLFDSSGKPVAEYLKQHNSDLILTSLKNDFTNDVSPSLLSGGKQQVFDSKHLSCFLPVYSSGKTVGTIYLLSDLSSLYARLRGVAYGVVFAFVLLLVGSWMLARWIQQPISHPLVQLADIMGRVSRSNNYSLRAEKLSTDEVGSLVDGFNRMLEQIEMQQKKLIAHQASLEQTVTERTAELREIVEQLDQARKLADSANEAKSDFLSKMTHELRTPLIGVLGMNELLQRTSLDEQQLLLTDTVQKSGEELLKLISDVLDISRIEAGKLELNPATVSLAQIIEDAAGLLTPMAQDKGLDLVTDISLDSVWRVHVDENRIRQIVMNLIGNAVKFTLSGHVAISLKCTVQDQQTGLFTLCVADTGIGMDEKSKTRVFDLFYQSDNAGTREQPGSGLGLSIVRQLVDLMDGDLNLHSDPGQGSSFRVQLRLPLVEKINFSIPQSLLGESVFLCMEESQQRAVLVERLSELNCKVDITANADNACYHLRAAQRDGKPYALILVDQAIQTMTGRPLSLLLREAEEFQSQRVILLCYDQSHQNTLLKNETKLQLPLRWSSLTDVLTSSRQNLQLVSGSSVCVTVDKPSYEGSTNIILLGQKVASRELLRLVLAKNNIDVRVVDHIDDLVPEQSANRDNCLLIDCPYLPEHELVEYLNSHQHDFTAIIMLSPLPLADCFAPFNVHYLQKPLNESAIENVLRPLLPKTCQRRGESA